MKRILILIIGLIGVAYGQSSPTSAKTRFVNGLYLGTKLDAYFNAADSNAIYWRADSVVMAKYKGTARRLLFASDSSIYLTNVVRTFGTQTVGGSKTFSNDIVVNNARVGIGAGGFPTNAVLGNETLGFNTTGISNTAIGSSALYSNTAGSNNIAIGSNSLFANTIGTQNVAIGKNALSNTTGSSNTAIGFEAGEDNTAGSGNIYLGAFTIPSAVNRTNETIIGYNLVGNGSNTVTIGNSSVTNNYFSGNVRANGIISDTGYFRGVTRYDSTAKFFKRVIVSPTGNSYFQDFGISEDGPGVYVNQSFNGGNVTNEHGFIDATTFSNRLNKAYNSYDAQATISGTANLDHHAAFQARPVISLTGGATMSNYWGFITYPTINSSVSNVYHFQNFGTLGSGTITNEYAYYAKPLRGSTLKYAFYAESDSSYFGNRVRLNNDILFTGASNRGIGFGGLTSAGAANALIYSDQNYLVINSKAGHRLFLNGDNTNASSLVDFFNGKATVNKDGAITATSSVTASSIIKSGGTSTQALMADGSVQTVTSGTYMPTLTNTQNISSSTASLSSYTRIGNIVTVYSTPSATTTAAGQAELTFSLPIATTAANAVVVGSGIDSIRFPINNGSSGSTVGIRWTATSGTATNMNVIFQYTVN